MSHGSRRDSPKEQLHIDPLFVPNPDLEEDHVDGITERAEQGQRVAPHGPLDVRRWVGQGGRDRGEERVGVRHENQAKEAVGIHSLDQPERRERRNQEMRRGCSHLASTAKTFARVKLSTPNTLPRASVKKP